jgi:hypothetical protein
MNTPVNADSTDDQTSAASSIATTMHQMSISFGVATAGLATAFFVPSNAHNVPCEMIHGVHEALLALGALTILSALVFRSLRSGDSDAVSRQKEFHPGG